MFLIEYIKKSEIPMSKISKIQQLFKMQIDRNFAFLCSIDTKKFTANQSKKQIQSTVTLQSRNTSQRPSLTQISFTHSFPSETLITNVQVIAHNMAIFQANIQSIDIEVSSLANRGHYSQLINFKSEKQQNQITISGAGFTHCIKISLLLKTESKKRNPRSNLRQIQQGLEKIVIQSIKDINVYGSTINSNPSSILLTKLLNISQSFRKYNLLQEAAQTDLLVSLSLITARRFVQAAQILRKTSKFYLEKYQNSKSIMDLNKTQKSWMRDEDQIGHSTLRSNFGNGRILQGNKSLQKAAKIELLLAQTISHPSLILQKLQAYHRCNAFAAGNVHPTPLRPDADLEDIAITIFSQICNFLLKNLSDKLEPLRIAALKSIEFFIQTLGCSIGSSFLNILKQVITTYPSNFSPQINSQRIPFGLHELQMSETKNQLQNIESGVTTIKNKLLLDHYHHLLQTLLSLMGQINKKIVISIFGQIILPSILSKTHSYELKLYLLRFSEKSISISGADLNIEVSFVGILLSFCEQKNINKNFINNSSNKKNYKHQNIKQQAGLSHNKHVIHNLVYFSHKILSILKTKILPRYSGHKMQCFLQWINNTLTYLGQNQMLSTNSHHSHFVFTTIHDFIISIYSIIKYDNVRIKHSPIETVLYFANMAISNHSAGLPFEKIIETLTILLKYHFKTDKNFQLNKQIISRILQKSKQHNLSLKQLQILIKVLEVQDYEDQIMLHWLNIYLGCIPHSTYDQTYQVFSIMLQKGIVKLANSPKKNELLKKIMNTMLDQYTVKGKAHQQAKQTLIQSLIKNKPENIIDLIQICLFQNKEPKPENYYSKRNPKAPSKINKQIEHHFDSKSYKIDFEMYMQKISMAQLILTKMSSQPQVYFVFIEQKFIQKFFDCMKDLAQTSSLKNKSKAISLINHYLEITSNGWKKQNIDIRPFLLIIRNMFALNKILIQKLKQSKLMYSAIYNIMSLFRFYTHEFEISQKLQETAVDQLHEELQQYLKNQKKNQQRFSAKKAHKLIHLFLLKEFIKNWPSFGQIVYSSWQHVRQIYFLLIMEVFKEGLSCTPQLLKRKTLQISKPFIFNLITSSEHSQRQAGLKIFGCLLGIRGSLDIRDNKIGQIICQNLRYLKPFVDRIYESTYDWNQKNVQIAQNLCQICMSEQTRLSYSVKRKQSMAKKGYDMQNSFLSFNLGDEMNLQRKNLSMYAINSNIQNLILKQSWFLEEQPISLQLSYCPKITQQLLNKIVQFKTLIQKQIQARTEIFGQKQSFMEQNEQQFYDMGEQKAESIDNKQKSQDDQLEFQDLGIIEVDDEQWGEQQQKQQKAIQKLPIKKIYKLSPSVLSSSKPQRIRSKRFHQNQFDYRQKIIVDELEQKQKIGTNIHTLPQQNFMYKNQTNNQIVHQKQRQKYTQKKQQRIQSNQRINYRNGMTQPLIIEDFDGREQDYEQFEQKLEKKQKIQKEVKRQEMYSSSNLIKQKQGQKKTKKASSTKKRKPSIGKS